MKTSRVREIRALCLPVGPLLITTALLVSGGFALAQDSGGPAVKPSPPAQVQARAAKPVVDWANLGRYREENAKLPTQAAGEDRVVFMGDSITDAWKDGQPAFFSGKPHVCRGISGQTPGLRGKTQGATGGLAQ